MELRDTTRSLHRPKDSASARRTALRRLVRRSFLQEAQQEGHDDEGDADPPHHVVLAANAVREDRQASERACDLEHRHTIHARAPFEEHGSMALMRRRATPASELPRQARPAPCEAERSRTPYPGRRS